MSHSPPYVLDASVFIQAARTYYAFDIVPIFWERLGELLRQGLVVSVDRVKHEIDRGNDELKNWTDDFFHAFQTTNDRDVLSAYAQLIQWAKDHLRYAQSAKAEFAKIENADAWVVAFAIAYNGIVVSQETSAPTSRVKIKLPDVCNAFNIECINTFEMLRRLNVTL